MEKETWDSYGRSPMLLLANPLTSFSLIFNLSDVMSGHGYCLHYSGLSKEQDKQNKCSLGRVRQWFSHTGEAENLAVAWSTRLHISALPVWSRRLGGLLESCWLHWTSWRSWFCIGNECHSSRMDGHAVEKASRQRAKSPFPCSLIRDATKRCHLHLGGSSCFK